MTAQLSPVPVAKFFSNDGFPLAFGQLTTYVAGTTTPQATYVDSTQTTQNTNPIQLNFRGECNLWLDPTKTYKFLLQDLFGNTIPGWPIDNIPGGFGALPISTSLIPAPTNTFTLGNASFSWANVYVGPNNAPVLDTVSGNIGYYARTAAEIAAGVTPTNYAYPPGNILRYGANTTPGTTDMSLAFINAAATAQTGHGFIYLPAAGGPYNFASTITFSNVNGIQIYGDAAAIITAGTHYAGNTVLIFDHAVSGSNGIVVNTFIGFKMRDLVISMRRGSSGGGRAIYLNSGHDFELDNIKIDLAVGNSGCGIYLGGGTGGSSTFLGNIRNCKVMSDGGCSFQSNNTNTSITFETCYSNGGYYSIQSNVYCSLIGCAADSAPAASLYAYLVETSVSPAGSPNQGISFISCGAESANRGAWYVNGAENCTWISPFGANNNTSGGTGYGDLIHFDATGTTNSNNTIISPSDANPNGSTTASIYANVGNGTVYVLNANSNYLSKGIGGDSTWMLNSLTVEGDSNLEQGTFTATIGTGWTNTGTPTVTGKYIKKGKLVAIYVQVAPATNIQAASAAQIIIPWTPSFNGQCGQFDGNGASYGITTVSTLGKIFTQATGVLTVPLYFQGSFFIS